MKRLLLSLLLLVALLAHPQSAQACSCATPLSISSAVAQVNAVFEGQVSGIADLQTFLSPLIDEVRYWLGQPFSGALSPNYGNLVTFQVAQSWKGITTSTAQVRTGYGGGDCGYLFSVGAHYLVYARGATAELVTGICSRTTELARATADLSYLSTLPTLPLVPTPASSSLWLGVVALVIVFLVLALAGFIGLRRQHHSQPSPPAENA